MVNERELYNWGRIVIDINEKDYQSHDLWLGPRGEGNYFMLQRGVLAEAARSSVSHVREMMDTVGSGAIEPILEHRGLTYCDIALAFAQAEIHNLEKKLSTSLDGSDLDRED